MKWYSARLLFETLEDGEDVDPLCEESIRLIQATDDNGATRKAGEVGLQGQRQYKNENGKTIKWKFVSVLEIQDLSESTLGHGVEVYSRMYWKREEDSE